MPLSKMIDAYLQSPAALRAAVSGMDHEQLWARPVEGKWSTIEVVAHLADVDTIFADWMKRIIATESPTMVGGFHTAFAENLAYQDRVLDDELTLIEATRKQLARILRTKNDSVLTRQGIINREGVDTPLTLEFVLQRMTDHVQEHIVHIHNKRKSMGLPDLSGV